MYELHSNYGAASFETENDAVKALFLLAPYHDIEIDEKKVRSDLKENAYYESFPLSLIRTGE